MTKRLAILTLASACVGITIHDANIILSPSARIGMVAGRTALAIDMRRTVMEGGTLYGISYLEKLCVPAPKIYNRYGASASCEIHSSQLNSIASEYSVSVKIFANESAAVDYRADRMDATLGKPYNSSMNLPVKKWRESFEIRCAGVRTQGLICTNVS